MSVIKSPQNLAIQKRRLLNMLLPQLPQSPSNFFGVRIQLELIADGKDC